MLSSPRYAAVTLRTFTWWFRVLLSPAARKTLRTLFNERYYLATHEDVRQSGVHPYLHYLFRGFLESRNPSELLDTAHYLALYPDVKRAQLNPALHYALYGKREQRSAVPARTEVMDGAREGSTTVPVLHINNAWVSGQPLVSVVIPCFNYGAYVEQAVESVLAQTFENLEVVLVEGGSTDGVTRQVVAGIENRRLPKVRVLFRPERRLVGDNRNYGISQAHGRYICCLDADDRLKPIYLEMAVFLAEAFAYDVIYSSVESFAGSDLNWILTDASFPGILEGNQVSTTALFRKSAWAHIGGFRDWGLGDSYIPEDWDFWIRMLGHGYRAKSIRETLMLYRVHDQGLMANCETQLPQQKAALRKANQLLVAEPAEAPRSLKVEIANRWANLLDHEAGAGSGGSPSILIALPFISVGGAEQLFHTLIRGLVAKGFRVVVITTVVLPAAVKSTPNRYDALTPHVYHLPKLLDEPHWEDFVHYLLERYNAGALLLAGSEIVYHCLPGIRSAFPGVRVVDQLFNDTGHIRNNRRYSAALDSIAVPSKALADVLVERYGERRERIRVIPHGIEAGGPVWEREAAWAVSGLPAQARGRLLVSFFGRMSKEKSPRVFVEIAARLAHRSDLYFCMTGEGPEWPAVQRLAAKYGLGGRLFLPGFVDDPRPLMELSDIVVLTSSLDGMPLVVLDAQALGKPVVVSAVGSLPDIVADGRTGFLCPSGDVDAFCRAIEQLADSETLRREMGGEARDFVQETYAAEAMVEGYVSALGVALPAVPRTP